MTDFDDMDPLDAAFANPKAGKKLKPGEMIPGMDQVARGDYDAPAAPDAALSKALDDAFSTSKFAAAPEPTVQRLPEDVLVTAAEEKLARNLDDAFANPKAGEKIQTQPMLNGVSPEQLGLAGYPSEMKIDDTMPAPSGGMFSPKFLVIGMLLAVVVVGFWVGGVDTTPSKPNVIRLTD